MGMTLSGRVDKITSVKKLLKKAISTSWRQKRHAYQRLLCHSNSASFYHVAMAAVLVLFYVILGASRDHYSCVQWSVDIGVIGGRLDHAHGGVDTDSRSQLNLWQWIFVLSGFILTHVFISFWGRTSCFALDSHAAKARRVFDGLKTIHSLDKCNNDAYYCLSNWAAGALDIRGIEDYSARHRRASSLKRITRHALYWILLVPAALFLSWPSLLYSLSKNVSSDSGLLQACRNSLAVVALNTFLRLVFLQPLVKALVSICDKGMVVDDLATNQRRTYTLFTIQLLSTVVLPCLTSILLDGVCHVLGLAC